MSDAPIEDTLNDIGRALRQRPSVRNEVMRRVTEAGIAETAPPAAACGRPPHPLRRLLRGAAALAACAVLAIAGYWMFGGDGGLGPQAAFAAAIESVQKARTFSANSISRSVDRDGKEQVMEIAVTFKEPNLKRIEYVRGFPEPQVMIRNYATRQELVLFPKSKTADVSDMSAMFSTEEQTGELKPIQLETSMREEVRKLSAKAVKDAGVERLNGRDVRVLRSAAAGGEPVTTVWVNPKTNKPVQIELTWPSRGNQSYAYTSIRIDEDLDDALFSTDPPEGYAVLARPDGGGRPVPNEVAEMNGKMLTKLRDLVMLCYKYQSKTKGDFPASPADLAAAGVTGERALRTMLAAPGQPDGPPVVLYRKPRAGKDSGTEIVFYEAPAHRRPGKVVVGMWDGHSEILDEKQFDELMK